MCQVRVLEIQTNVSRVDDKNSRGETSGSLQVAVKVVIVGRRWRVVQGRPNCEERRAPYHDSTNGWPLHGWNAWRLSVHYILCQCHEGRAPAALQDESKHSRELLLSHQRCHVTYRSDNDFIDEGRERLTRKSVSCNSSSLYDIT